MESSRVATGPDTGCSELHESTIRLRPPVAIELPNVSHLANLVEIELGGDELRLVARCFDNELPAGIAEVALTIELADVPRPLDTDAIDSADEERIRDRVGRLLESPQILGQPGHRRRGIEHDLGAVQPELARALREVSIVTDIHADVGVLGLEHRVAKIAGTEIELLPEPRAAMRDVVLSILS